MDLVNLEAIVEDFYFSVRRDEKSLLAYKGGHYDRDLLRNLDIPSVNLESFGWPRAVHIIDQLDWRQSCGNHLELGAYEHCAKVEVEAFGLWLDQQ